MHGRRRDEYKARLADPKMAAAMGHKAQQWNTLSQKLLLRLEDQQDKSLALTEKLLLVNPDPLVLWNKRRNLLLLESCGKIKLDPELVLTASCLERNPKAYGPWFHRKWCLSKRQQQAFHDENESKNELQKELDLCSKFLQLDERNFHCWNYRRFVVGLMLGEALDGAWNTGEQDATKVTMGAQIVVATTVSPRQNSLQISQQERNLIIQAEWDFTSQKIQQNFSNFSAFHYRSKLLELRLKEKSEEEASLLAEELELVHNAIFTEPDDQTAWWYHRFLLVECFSATTILQVLQTERDLIVELTQEEDQSKWAWLGLHVVLTELDARGEPVQEQLHECLDHLIRLDPDRSVRYASIKKK